MTTLLLSPSPGSRGGFLHSDFHYQFGRALSDPGAVSMRAARAPQHHREPLPSSPALHLFLERSFHTRPDLGFPFGISGTSTSSFNVLDAGAWAEDPFRFLGPGPSLTGSLAGGGLLGSRSPRGQPGDGGVSSCSGGEGSGPGAR